MRRTMSIYFYNFVVFASMLGLYISIYAKKAYVLRCIVFIVLFIISSIREGIGTDYVNYKEIYDFLAAGDTSLQLEPFFYIINIMVAKFGFDFRAVIIITSFLFVFPIIRCIDKRISIWVLFYFILSFYLASFNAIRQAIALSISCFALYQYMNDDKKYKYSVFILCATMFHYSALIGLIVIVAKRYVFPVWINLLFIILFYLFLSVLTPIFLSSSFFLATKYAFYSDTDFIDAAKLGSGFGLILQLLPFVVIIILNRFIFQVGEVRNFSVNVSMLLVLTKMLTLQISIFHRLEYSLVFMLAILFGEVANRYKNSYLNFGLFLYLFAWSILQFEMQLINNVNEIMPYQTFFGSL